MLFFHHPVVVYLHVPLFYMKVNVFETAALDLEERLTEMKRILTEELPADNYFVLKYVVHFLTEVRYHHNFYKLQIVFVGLRMF